MWQARMQCRLRGCMIKLQPRVMLQETTPTCPWTCPMISVPSELKQAQPTLSNPSIEALTLLLVSFAFLVIVSWSLALIRASQRDAECALLSVSDRENMRPSEANAARIVIDTIQAAAEQRRRLTAACVIVLITFPARTAFDLLNAYSNFNDPVNPACGLCESCQTTPYIIRNWLDHTPEFRSIVIAVSSPLPLTLSLWLLTKAHARVRLIAADVERAVRAHAGDTDGV